MQKTGFPNISDKLMVGIEEEERGEWLMRWLEAEVVDEDKIQLGEGNGDQQDIPGAKYLLLIYICINHVQITLFV